MTPKITMCLMSCGEETEQECLAALQPFRDKIVLQEVRNVCPQITALNQMIDQAETEYLIPLDADIVLFSDAYERVQRAIEKFEHDPNWHTILFKLYDTFTEREILALKILRTRIMKVHPFRESATPDVEHFQRLTAEGYTCIDRLLVKNPIGKHILRGKHFCYNKYRDVYQTLRVHGWEWDSAVFMGGTTTLEKAKRHFDYFITRHLFSNNTDYLWAIAGMVDGLTAPVENCSKTLADREYLVSDESKILDVFWDWYLGQNEKYHRDPLF